MLNMHIDMALLSCAWTITLHLTSDDIELHVMNYVNTYVCALLKLARQIHTHVTHDMCSNMNTGLLIAML